MSETIVQTAILVFAAGFVGFALGCLVARLFATSASGEQASASAQATAQPAPARASTAAQPAPSASATAAPAEPAPARTAPVEPAAAAAAAPQSEPAPAATPASQPVSAGAAPASGQDGADKPSMLTAPRDGSADDLKRIKGVGPKLEQMLNSLGIYHFDQIANWTPDNVAWVDGNLKFRGRIDREEWIAQAKQLSGK